MIDFGLLPPEINSGRMYAGAGAGPLIAAAAAWEGLACELSSTAVSYGSTVTELTGGPWLGPASRAMLAAAAPYVAWLSATAAQAEQAGAQASAAVAAYEDAFAMTVPPPAIAANRAELLLLIATNFFGQNTPAIAATEARYAEMWAQDATAMYAYAGSSAAASKVAPFNAPPPTTDPAGLAGQAAAVTHAAGTPAGAPTALPSTLHLAPAVPTLHPLAQPTTATSPTLPAPALPASPKPPGSSGLSLADLNSAWKFGLSWTNGSSMHTLCAVFRYNLQTGELPKASGAVKDAAGAASKAAVEAQALGAASPLVAGGGGGSPVAAGMGQASHVGALSVPGNFPGAPPASTSSIVSWNEAAAPSGGPRAGGAMAGLPGISGRATSGHELRFVPQYGYRHKVMARPPGAG